MSLRLTILILGALLTFACGEEEEEKDSTLAEVTDFFLTSADFSGTNDETLDTLDLVDEINEASVFYNNEPDSTDASDQCFAELMESQAKFSAEGSTITFSAHIDNRSCFQGEEGFSVSSSTTKVFGTFECEGDTLEDVDLSGDVSSFNTDGKNCTKRSFRNHIETTLAGSFTFGEQTTAFNNRFISYSGAGLTTSCDETVEGDVATQDGCVDVTHSLSYLGSQTTPNSVKVTSLAINNLTRTLNNKTDPYYTGGTITGDVGDWQITMTYTDGTTAPTWEATNGSDSTSGTFGSATTLALNKHLRKVFR